MAEPHPDAALGKVMFPADAPRFRQLKDKMETEWIPQLMACLQIAERDMPVIWDADFLYGPPDGTGADTYVLCEVNVSSVFAIPDPAAAAIAQCVSRRLSDAPSPFGGSIKAPGMKTSSPVTDDDDVVIGDVEPDVGSKKRPLWL